MLGTALNWFNQDYRSNRAQAVSTNGQESKSMYDVYGVVKESSLEPLLSLFYINILEYLTRLESLFYLPTNTAFIFYGWIIEWISLMFSWKTVENSASWQFDDSDCQEDQVSAVALLSEREFPRRTL